MFEFIRELRPKAHARGLIRRKAQGCVLSGPFAGMRYAMPTGERVGYPYLIGSHECELSPIVEQLCRTPLDTVVNVGAAEGYFAVGFARRNSTCKVLAFEMDPQVQQRTIEMARINAVHDRVRVLGLCDAPALAQSLADSGSTLVVMDIEGTEAVLLDPFVVPRLKEAHILVELHDFVYRGMGDLIRQRFAPTHDITEIWSRDRIPADFPPVLSAWQTRLLQRSLLRIMHEGRCGKMRWFYLRPHSAPLPATEPPRAS